MNFLIAFFNSLAKFLIQNVCSLSVLFSLFFRAGKSGGDEDDQANQRLATGADCQPELAGRASAQGDAASRFAGQNLLGGPLKADLPQPCASTQFHSRKIILFYIFNHQLIDLRF